MSERLEEWVAGLNRTQGITGREFRLIACDATSLTLACRHQLPAGSELAEALLAEIGLLAVKGICLDLISPDQSARVIECKFDYQHPVADTEWTVVADLIRQGRSIIMARAHITSNVNGEHVPLVLLQASLMIGSLATAQGQSQPLARP